MVREIAGLSVIRASSSLCAKVAYEHTIFL